MQMNNVIGKEEFYLKILNQLPDGIYFVNSERMIMFWNKGAEEITGYSAEEIVGKSCQTSGLNHIDKDGNHLCLLGCPLFATIRDGRQRQHKVLVRHKEGYRIPLHVNIFPISQAGTIIGAVEVFTKDSPKVYDDSLVQQLTDVATHDELTKLPNRRYVESFLAHRLDEFNRFGHTFCVLFADIDDFSEINNAYGHDAGDIVLKNVAESFNQNLRCSDIIGRWGGEEFVGIYSASGNSESRAIGERFLSLVRNTEAVHEGRSISVTISVGVTMIQPDDTMKSVLNRADQLMYESKKNGKNQATCG